MNLIVHNLTNLSAGEDGFIDSVLVYAHLEQLPAQLAAKRVLLVRNDLPRPELMHKLALFKACPRKDLAMVHLLTQRLINIPSSSGLVSPTE